MTAIGAAALLVLGAALAALGIAMGLSSDPLDLGTIANPSRFGWGAEEDHQQTPRRRRAPRPRLEEPGARGPYMGEVPR